MREFSSNRATLSETLEEVLQPRGKGCSMEIQVQSEGEKSRWNKEKNAQRI
jgi:hypothetical protein